MRYFIITIDTEGDNLWEWKEGDRITTYNAEFLPRFQSLCNNYGFKPVWLTNYEMICDESYCNFISKIEQDKMGELGMHLHAWNTPPYYELPIIQKGAPYLVEYPVDIMEEKILTMHNAIVTKTGIEPISHRAGRWAMNQNYFDLLIKYGYKIDCSVTPHINWSGSCGRTEGFGGTDYSNYPSVANKVYSSKDGRFIWEVPVTTKVVNKFFLPNKISLKSTVISVRNAIKGEVLWLRPNGHNIRKMQYLIDLMEKSKDEYIMFMLHSSELMPGGSPTFADKDSIETLYIDLEYIFSKLARNGFVGTTLREYEKQLDLHRIGN